MGGGVELPRSDLERTGRLPIAPTNEGFGSALAQRSVVGQLGGTITYDWQPRGLSIKISIPMERLSS